MIFAGFVPVYDFAARWSRYQQRWIVQTGFAVWVSL